MKKLSKLNIFSLLLLFISINVCAQEFNDGVLRYRVLDEEEATCEVIGPVSANPEGELVVAQNIKNDNKTYTVTSIGSNAFYGLNLLTNVSLPQTLLNIADYAFFRCSALKKIDIPGNVINIGNNAFYWCNNLNEINIPDSAVTLGDGVFSGCGLSRVSIPASVESIGRGAFADCINLKEIIVDEKNKRYKSLDGILYNIEMDTLIQCPATLVEVKVPTSVKVIWDHAFEGCELLENVLLPSTMEVLGTAAFGVCRALKSIEIPEGITDIDCFTFADCSSLKEVKLPSTLKWIEADSFSYCRSLSTLTMPENLESIIINAFVGCTALESITFLADHYVYVNWDRLDHPTFPKLYVKEHLLDDYKTSVWAVYAKEILPIPIDSKDSSGIDSIAVDQKMPFDIYNINGLLVKKNVVKADLSELPAGVYILKQGVASQRILIR